jgi:hypothetical protein
MQIRINYAPPGRWRLTFGKGWRRTRLCRRLYVETPTHSRLLASPAYNGKQRAYLVTSGVIDLQGSTAIIRRPRREHANFAKKTAS